MLISQLDQNHSTPGCSIVTTKDYVILIKKITCMAGIAGVLIIVLGIVLSAVSFTGAYGESYSLLNHNISELGERGVSNLAWLFNGSLVAGGLCLILFMLGLNLCLHDWPVYLISVAGIVAVTGIMLSGLTPMVAAETSVIHIDAARLFFYGGMLSTFFYSLYVLLGRSGWFPKWTMLLSVLALISFWAFVYLPGMIFPGFTVEDYLVRRLGENRPALFLPSLLEWLVMFFAVLWIAVMSLFICRPGKK